MGSILVNVLIAILSIFYLFGYKFWPFRKQIAIGVCLSIIIVSSGLIWQAYNKGVTQKDVVRIPAPLKENIKNKVAQRLAFEEGHEPQNFVVLRPVFDSVKKIKPLEKPSTPNIFSNPMVGQRLWKTNAAALAPVLPGQAMVTIVIDDLGILKGRTRKFIEIDAPLTLSFLPYASQLPELTRLARTKGHELMVHLPMEPKGDSDPGPHAMLTSLTSDEARVRLAFNLSRFEGYVGINNHMGSAYTEDSQAVEMLLSHIEERGLLVLDSMTSSGSVLSPLATKKNIANVTRDVFLDNIQETGYILDQLEKVETMAIRRGQVIAIGHPYSQTIEALNLWLPTLKDKNIVVVPLSQIVKRKYTLEEDNKLAGRAVSGGEVHR